MKRFKYCGNCGKVYTEESYKCCGIPLNLFVTKKDDISEQEIMFCPLCHKLRENCIKKCKKCGSDMITLGKYRDTIGKKAKTVNISIKESSNNLGGNALTILFIILFIIGTIIFFAKILSPSDDSKYCSSCNRSFTDTDNKKSISWRNMCENCYENYKFSQEVLEELEKWK